MSFAISSLNSIVRPDALQNVGQAASAAKKSSGFASVLEGAIQSVDQQGKDANQAIQNFLNGDGEELHNVAMTVQRASLAFDLGLQVRNKIVSAYQEVMRMQM